MFILDAHLDLSMNAMEWNRDLTRPIQEIREREKGLTGKPDWEKGTVCLPEMRRGRIGICVATLIARYAKPTHPLKGWRSPAQAWAQIHGQLEWYRMMEEMGEMRMLKTGAEVETMFQTWTSGQAGRSAGAVSPGSEHLRHVAGDASQMDQGVNLPIGFVLSLECADAVVTVRHLERLHQEGLRAIGPAHYGPGTYAQGTDWTGGIGRKGRELLEEIGRWEMILDATHLCDDSFWEAMNLFSGPVWASHSNVRALVPHNRQYSDEQIKHLISRGSVIGTALDAWMLVPNWIRGQTTPESSGVSLKHVVDHIDYVCQLAGNANHSGIGSDLDGAFGLEQSPGDLDTIADLQKICGQLELRGYTSDDIRKIMHGNFFRFLTEHLK